MRIRKYQEKDKEQIRELIEEILWEIFNKEPRKLRDLDNIKKEYTLFLVAEDYGKVIGTSGLIIKKDLGVLKRLFVKKEYRRKGIARNLYNKIENFCKKSKINKIILSTSPKMKEAIKFYKKNGFKQRKINKKKNSIFMEKRLA